MKPSREHLLPNLWKARRISTMAPSTTTHERPVRDIESLPLPPMPPKILETYKAMWSNPHLFDDVDPGEEGVWVAMHGGEIVAVGPELTPVLRMVDDYGQDDIL